ncbi:MAG: response regulator [Deltaproteobacteria bacterium]|nr:response regulator [Deltaproteobacteria bacterium]MBW2018933.1 response regulator [Deltaproteobacteria bacterium]MBW2073148.1 response regulator [Deltaproteobacteria bacterium]RLB83767.1 MAG: transcriptional regulator [Deltaproteobacteria bacterium]
MSEPLNILVVDDDEMILQVFKDFLNRTETYSVLTARDGAEALKIFGREQVDFCFTDLNMPGMDGIEFTRQVHELDNTIPVVVMTGYPSTDNAIATLKHGVVDFLVKPFRIGEIEVTIRRALEQKALFIENMLLKEEVKKKERIAQLNEELSNKVRDLKILNMILQKVDWVTRSSDLFDLIVKLSAEITSSDEVHFYILDDTFERPTPIASFYKGSKSGCSEDTGKQADQACRLGDSNSYFAERLAKKISEGMPLLIDGSYDKTFSDANISSLVVIPFKIRNKLFGMLAAIARNGSAPLSEKDLYYLNFLAERATFVIENVALYENIYENLFATLYAFVEAIEARDPYTKQHSSRVTELALRIGKEMGCSDEQLDLLNFSGYLHDIGKIGIRDSILLKPGPLTEQEYEAIKKHPIIGANIVGHLGLLVEEQKIILHHHERWDGKGYPDGLKGESIPFLSRILTVADVYDAMASDRAYRKRLPDEVVIRTIKQNAGSQFDKQVVDAFLRVCKNKPAFLPTLEPHP